MNYFTRIIVATTFSGLLTCTLYVIGACAAPATKVSIKNDGDKSIAVYTRTIPARPDHVYALRSPAPANACPTIAFEVLNNRAGEARCVGGQ